MRIFRFCLILAISLLPAVVSVHLKSASLQTDVGNHTAQASVPDPGLPGPFVAVHEE